MSVSESSRQPPDGKHATPERLHADFQDAFNRHDLEAVLLLYEPDAVLVRPDGVAEGALAIREAYRAVFAFHPRLTLETVRVHRSGDLAVLYGRWSWVGVRPDGDGVQNRGSSVEVVRRQADGRWLFVIDNPMPA